MQSEIKKSKKLSLDIQTKQIQQLKTQKTVAKLFRISAINYLKMSELDKMIQQSNKRYKTQAKENDAPNITKTLEVYETIHIGIFSIVYKVRHLQNGKHYALKKVKGDKKHQSRQERICKVIKNNFIVEFIAVYRSQKVNQRQYNILMKLYPWSLKDFINNKPQIDRTMFQIILYQIVRAIHYLHAKGVCHRDVTSSNFMMSTSGRVYLGDFGSAKFLKKDEKSVFYVGMRAYRAPQLLMGSQTYSNSIDIWSIGCIALQLLTGKEVFNGTSTLDTLLNIGRYLGTKDFKKLAGDQQLSNMLPAVKGRGLQQLMQSEDKSLLDLLSRMLCIDPEKRVRAIGILAHDFFDSLRQEQTFIDLGRKNIDISDFFIFSATEVYSYQEYHNKLIPIWKRERPDKHASKAI